jgi:Domain of unknown function (DUF4190)
VSEEGWHEPETSAAAGRQAGPRDADPFAPPSETTAGTALPPSEYPGAPGYQDGQAEASAYRTAPPYGIPPSYGMPAVPPQPHAYPPPPYPPAAVQPYGYPPYGYAPPPQRTSGVAIASLVLGLVWIYWIGSILAVIFGHLAFNETRRDPRVGGRGMAIAGMVLGYLGLAVLLIGLIALTVSGTSSPTPAD